MPSDVIRLVLPVALRDVFDALAPSFTAATGDRFEVATMLNPEVPDYVATGGDWGLAVSNPRYIERIVRAGGCEPPRPLGRAPLALGVLDGGGGEAPATTPDAIAAILRSARSVAVTERGTSGACFARLIDALGVRRAVEPALRPVRGGEPMAMLLAGRVAVAALPLTNIAPVPGVRVAAVCPDDLDVHVDLAFCVRTGANEATKRFARWLDDPANDAAMDRLGLDRRGVARARSAVVAPGGAYASIRSMTGGAGGGASPSR